MQMANDTRLDEVLAALDAGQPAALDRLKTFLRIPSVSTDPAYAPEVRRAAGWLRDELAALGFAAEVRETAGHPVVVARTAPDGSGARRLLFYGHYDVQPVDPIGLWTRDPFDPVVEDTPDGPVIRGRGASDDKGQLMTFVEACRAWKSAHGALPAGLTLLFEGEEESGSPNLMPFLQANAAEFATDLALICDTGMYLSRVGLRHPVGETGRTGLEMVWNRPTFEINGISGGYAGDGFKTVLPAEARAKVSCRLVGTQDPEAIRAALQAHVRAHVPEDCSVEFHPHGSSQASRMDVSDPAFAAARAALNAEWGRDAAFIGMGGSIPVAGDFQRLLDVDVMLIGFGRDNDRIHSPNEKYNLESFAKGARSWARILAALR